MPLRTLQIATMGTNPEPVLVGVRALPVHKLYLIHLEEDRPAAKKLMMELSSVIKIDVESYSIPESDILPSVIEGIASILKKEKGNFTDIIVNCSSGEKILGCSALSAAFINGLKTIAVWKGQPMLLPVLKFSYDELVSQTKVDVLRSLQEKGGEVGSLAELTKITGYGKPLLSYHLHGAQDSRGLVELGLVEIGKGTRGRTTIRITALGRLLILGK